MSTLNPVEVTREGLLKAGFLPRKVWQKKPGEQTHVIIDSPNWLVHRSIPEQGLRTGTSLDDYPVIGLYGNHYEAKYGAQYFILRTDAQLQGFMQVFNYPFP